MPESGAMNSSDSTTAPAAGLSTRTETGAAEPGPASTVASRIEGRIGARMTLEITRRAGNEPTLRGATRRRRALGPGEVAERAQRRALLRTECGRLRLTDAPLLGGELLAIGV